MARRTKPAEGDPARATGEFRELLAEAVRRARQEANKVSDPTAQARFETAAEVLDGLIRACDRAGQTAAPAWT